MKLKEYFSPAPAKEFVSQLLKAKFRFFTGVSDSTLDPILREARRRELRGDCRLIQTNHEEIAVGIAAGHFLGSNRIPVVYLQNSGFCYASEPIISLLSTFQIPIFLIVGWRGYDPQEETSEPHLNVGKCTTRMISSTGIACSRPVAFQRSKTRKVAPWNVLGRLKRAITYIRKERRPRVFLMPEGTMTAEESDNPFLPTFPSISSDRWAHTPAEAERLMEAYSRQPPVPRREAVMRIIDEYQRDPRSLFVICNGYLSRDVRAWADDTNIFYNTGFYGGSLALGIGLALAQPKKKIIVLDGNDNAVAGSGVLPVIEMLGVENLHYYIFDNGVALSTGGHSSVPLSFAHFLHAKEVVRICDDKYHPSPRVPATRVEMRRFQRRAIRSVKEKAEIMSVVGEAEAVL
ncbi:MAG: thiamine pyrophosphate-binding protein [Nitrospinota bacterium]